MAQELSFRDIQVRSSDVAIRTITLNDLWRALKEGYDDFDASPTSAVFLAVLFPLFAFLLTYFLVGQNLLHLVFPIVAGLTFIGPVISVIAFFVASAGERLGSSSITRSTFSTTTMASSTRMPIANTIASKEIVLAE